MLFELRKKAPHARIALLQENTLENMIETATALRAETISPEAVLIQDKEHLQNLQRHGFKVIVGP